MIIGLDRNVNVFIVNNMQNIEKLIQLNIEIEGLLRILSARDSEDAVKELTLKFDEYSALFYELFPPTYDANEQFLGDFLQQEEITNDKQDEIGDSLAPETNEQFTTTSDGNVSIDQMLSRNKAKDLSKAFTINDKFRFINELFNGDHTFFNETINKVSQMETFDQATFYFLSSMDWDMENEAVKDFVNLIAKHFNAD